MKILIYGLPKSGTTTLHHRTKEALESLPGVAAVSEIYEPVALATEDGAVVYRNGAGTAEHEGEHTIAKALLPRTADWPGLDPGVVLADLAHFDKKVFIYRDPRDRWVSNCFYRWFHGHNPDPDAFARVLRLTRHKEEHPRDLPFHALFTMSPAELAAVQDDIRVEGQRVVEFVKQARDSGWHILRYEDLIDGKTDELHRYLGFELSENRKVPAKFARVARSKRYGDWRRWFTPEDVEFFRPLHGEVLELLGYDTDDWALEDLQQLPAAEGSEYMLRLFTPPDGAKRGGDSKKKWFPFGGR